MSSLSDSQSVHLRCQIWGPHSHIPSMSRNIPIPIVYEVCNLVRRYLLGGHNGMYSCGICTPLCTYMVIPLPHWAYCQHCPGCQWNSDIGHHASHTSTHDIGCHRWERDICHTETHMRQIMSTYRYPSMDSRTLYPYTHTIGPMLGTTA